MSDDNSGGESTDPPKQGFDLSKLEGFSGGSDPTKPSPATERAFKEAARLADIAKTAMPSKAVQEALEMTRRFGPNSSIGKVIEQIQDQQRSIDSLRLSPRDLYVETPRMPDALLRPPANPIHETNDRLERIEQRFEQMLDVAANGAEIATGLQAHAAEFLVKFEDAASDNDRSAARAIRLGAIAVVIAIAMPVAQIAYTELWRVPKDSASMEVVITDMQTEIAALRRTQIEAAGRIASALERSDQQMVEALQDIARSLASPPSQPVEEPARAD